MAGAAGQVPEPDEQALLTRALEAENGARCWLSGPGGDAARIDRLFRQSGLMREKWNRADYREATIRKALDKQTDFYQPGRRTHGQAESAPERETPRERLIQGGGERKEILLRRGQIAWVAQRVETALAADPECDIFQQHGRLVYPVLDVAEAADGRTTRAVSLIEADVDALLLRLSERMVFLQTKGKNREEVDPPQLLARMMLARCGRWQYRRLAGVISCPTLRRDLSILAEDGYDEPTGLLLVGAPTMPEIPECPTREDAERAHRLLADLLSGFPFAGEADAAAAISALMTPVLRPMLRRAPLHLVTAPSAGTGKSLLVDVAAAIATGRRAPVIAASGAEQGSEELDKRLCSCLLEGRQLIALDNVAGLIRSDLLSQILTQSPIQVRKLGTNVQPEVDSVATVFATGNNVTVSGDLLRRTLRIRLDARCERPELREFAFDPLEQVLADRGKYVAAVLTLPLAYATDGLPGRPTPLASFEPWSDLVRGAIRWVTGVDPLDTMGDARAEDPDLEATAAVFAAWHETLGSEPVTVKDLVQAAGRESGAELRDALLAVAGRAGEIEQKRLAYWLRSRKGRILNGLRLEEAGLQGHSKNRRYSVSKV